MLVYTQSMFFFISGNSHILKFEESMLSNSIKEGRRIRVAPAREESGYGKGRKLEGVLPGRRALCRCSGDKCKLLELVQSDEHFKQMEEDAYEVVTNYVRAEELIQVKEEYSREDGRIDMCQALKELLADERMEGREEGRELGRKELVLRMYADGTLDVRKACTYLGCTPEEFMGYVKMSDKG